MPCMQRTVNTHAHTHTCSYAHSKTYQQSEGKLLKGTSWAAFSPFVPFRCRCKWCRKWWWAHGSQDRSTGGKLQKVRKECQSANYNPRLLTTQPQASLNINPYKWSYTSIHCGTPLMRTPLGPRPLRVSWLEGCPYFRGCLMYARYFRDRMQCPHYSGCPYFRGVRKAWFHCIYVKARFATSGRL